METILKVYPVELNTHLQLQAKEMFILGDSTSEGSLDLEVMRIDMYLRL